jgi:hypothetical protein
MTALPAVVPFPVADPHYVYVQARRRNSGLTSVRWHDDETLYASDFSAKALYRVKPFADRPIDAQTDTLDGQGRPTQTDLMDLRGDTLVMTNFYCGEVGVYEVGPDTIRFERVIRPPARPAPRRRSLRSLFGSGSGDARGGRRVHGAVFVPGYQDLLWVSSCDAHQRGVEIITLDGTPVHSLPTVEQAQDVAFVELAGVNYAIQAARTNHITVRAPNDIAMYATLYVFRLPPDLRRERPELLVTQRFSGHLDAMKGFRGSVYGANQYDDCVDQFTYCPKENRIDRVRRLTGFDMPHGLDIRHDGLMAVTNYGPANDLRFFQLA